MTLNQLQYVVEVAKTGSINSAAGNLFVSQSVLSTAISNLENEVGHAIFTRSNRGVVLTSFGRTFVSYLSSIQDQLQQLNHLINYGTKETALNLSIASSGYYFLDKICAKIYQKYRDNAIRIEIIEDHINNIADMVANQSADIGIVSLWTCYKKMILSQIHAKRLEYHTIATMDIAVTVGSKNALYHSDNNTLTAEDLRPYPSILYTYNDTGPYSDIYGKLSLKGSGSRIVTSSRSVIYETLHNTDAFYLNSFYPFDTLDTNGASVYSDLRTFLLRDCPIHSEIAWIKRDDSDLSEPALELITQMKHYFTCGNE